MHKNKPKTCQKLNVASLRDEETKYQYQKKVTESFKDAENVQWNNVISTVLSAGEEVLGKQTPSHKPTPNKTISELSKKQLNLRLQKESCSDPEKRSSIQKERNRILKQIKKEVKLEKGKQQLLRIENVESCKNDSRRMFAAVRELNNNLDKSILVEGPTGYVHSPEQKVEVITEYFENIFSQDTTNDIPVITPQKLKEPITAEEVNKAVKKLKNNKSPGCDNVQAELIKYGPEIVHQYIADILNTAAETGDYPQELKLGQLIPLPKPNKTKGPVKNLRPIILLSVLRKILAIIVVGRTFKTLREKIPISQAAYSPGRSTTELVFSFKLLTEKAICAKDYTIYLLMLDMSRAFDTIDRGTLLNDLSDILEPDELHLVSLLLIDVKLQVKYNNHIGKTFIPDIGSPQGDCASPIWFIFYLYKALSACKSCDSINLSNNFVDIKHDHSYFKKRPSITEQDHPYSKKNKINKSQKNFIIDQQYADDASWATTSEEAKNNIKTNVPKLLKNNNLLVNEDKTEDYKVTRGGEEDWKNCKFLGSLLGNNEDITRRKQLACAAFNKNKTVLCSKKIALNIRIRVFVALISSVFLYNSELWSLSTKNANKIDIFQRKFLRQIVGKYRISNIELYKVCELQPWSVDIRRRRLTWFGHVNRLPDNAPAKLALAEVTRPYKRVRGGQKTTWLSTLKKDFESLNTTITDAKKITHDRDLYALLVHSAMVQVTKPNAAQSAA